MTPLRCDLLSLGLFEVMNKHGLFEMTTEISVPAASLVFHVFPENNYYSVYRAGHSGYSCTHHWPVCWPQSLRGFR